MLARLWSAVLIFTAGKAETLWYYSITTYCSGFTLSFSVFIAAENNYQVGQDGNIDMPAVSERVLPDAFTGQLLIQFIPNTASILCGGDFGINEAHAICKQVGYYKAARYEECQQKQ